MDERVIRSTYKVIAFIIFHGKIITKVRYTTAFLNI